MLARVSESLARVAPVQNAGFRLTINAINGQIECKGGNPQAVTDRVNAYVHFAGLLGVPPGDNLSC